MKEMTGYGQSRDKDKKHGASLQHCIPVGLFYVVVVIMHPCYFSQPKQIVEEIVAPWPLLFFMFLFSFPHFIFHG